MNIRCETLLDYQKIAQVNNLAFGQENEAQLIVEIRGSNRYILELSLVAEVDNNIVGHILLSYIDLIVEESAVKILPVLSLAPIAVLPQFQNQGIGTALIQAGLEKADEMQEKMVIVLGNPSFYNRFGFVSSVIYEIDCPFKVPADFFMVKPLKHYQSGYKGRVVYPSAFLQV
jgi:putative acetyltransferase